MKSNRHVPIIYGIIFCAIGLFLFFKFDFLLWTILGALLIFIGILNFKVGLFASDKAMQDLTTGMDKGLNETTKKEIRKLIDKPK